MVSYYNLRRTFLQCQYDVKFLTNGLSIDDDEHVVIFNFEFSYDTLYLYVELDYYYYEPLPLLPNHNNSI